MVEVNVYTNIYNSDEDKEKGIIDESKVVAVFPNKSDKKGILIYHVSLINSTTISVDKESYEKLKGSIENKKEELDSIEQALRIIEKAKLL